MKNRKEVFDKLQESIKLPTPSGTALEVMRLCRSESSSLNEIGEIIQTDPALSAEILKYANSAFLATGIQVASIQKATVKLGMKTVVNLVLGFSLLSDNKTGTCGSFDYPLFWSTSLAEAIAARELARLEKKFDPEELFVCGLLAHMGRLTLASLFPDEYANILTDQPLNDPPKQLEQAQFGIDSAELTVELFLSWGLPVQYALATGFHEDLNCVELGSGATHGAAVLLNIAHQIAMLCQSREPLPGKLSLIETTAKEFNLDIGNFSETFATIVESWHEYGQIFEISTSECPSYDDVTF